MSNKVKGIVKAVSNKNGSILLFEAYTLEDHWWNGIGDTPKQQIKQQLKGKEIELTVVNQEKKTFSYLKVLNENVQNGEIGNTEEIELRSIALYHAIRLAKNDKILIGDIQDYASTFLKFLKGEK